MPVHHIHHAAAPGNIEALILAFLVLCIASGFLWHVLRRTPGDHVPLAHFFCGTMLTFLRLQGTRKHHDNGEQ